MITIWNCISATLIFNVMQNYDVFISYATKDYMYDDGRIIPNNIITRLQNVLSKAGISYWIDKQGLLAGDEFPTVISEQIRSAKVFLYVSSSNANESDWTLNEIATARAYGKRIIPFRYDDTPYNTSIMIYLAGLQYVNYYDNKDKSLEEIVVAIRRSLEQPPLPVIDCAENKKRRWRRWNWKQWFIIGISLLVVLIGVCGGVGYKLILDKKGGAVDVTEAVYVTPSGQCYHENPECRHVRYRPKVVVTKAEAEKDGRRPCKDCCK